jgi:hypothetical protein
MGSLLVAGGVSAIPIVIAGQDRRRNSHENEGQSRCRQHIEGALHEFAPHSTKGNTGSFSLQLNGQPQV